MGKTIILTTANIEENSNNTKLVYNFPSGGYSFKNDMIALQSVYQYFSIFNITSDYGNNSFSYTWFDEIEYSITIPDGYYEISDLNSYFQSIMIANTHYMTNSAGQFIYFLEFIVNTSRYAVQINSYPLDTTIQTTNGYILPTGATWSVPATSTLSQFNVNTSAFGEVLGYEIGSYPDTQVGSSTSSFLSSKAPQITPYSSILVSCNLVNNRAVIPSNILSSYTPLGTSIGSLFTFEPNYLQFADVEDGQYTQLVLEFRDQLSRSIIIRDPNMLISLYTETKNKNI
jgi:hypothetical protein